MYEAVIVGRVIESLMHILVVSHYPGTSFKDSDVKNRQCSLRARGCETPLAVYKIQYAE
jgi:hypothetical protein